MTRDPFIVALPEHLGPQRDDPYTRTLLAQLSWVAPLLAALPPGHLVALRSDSTGDVVPAFVDDALVTDQGSLVNPVGTCLLPPDASKPWGTLGVYALGRKQP